MTDQTPTPRRSKYEYGFDNIKDWYLDVLLSPEIMIFVIFFTLITGDVIIHFVKKYLGGL